MIWQTQFFVDEYNNASERRMLHFYIQSTHRKANATELKNGKIIFKHTDVRTMKEPIVTFMIYVVKLFTMHTTISL